MGRKTEPESARDMWWAQQQMAGDVRVEYERQEGEPEEGALHSVVVSVGPHDTRDEVEVTKERWYYDRRKEGSSGWPLRCDTEWSRKMTFGEFRASGWWETYLEKTKNLEFDSSWMDSFQVDCQEKYVVVTFDVPCYQRVWWCSSEIPTGDTTPYSVYVCDDGTMGVTRGNEPTVERTVDEILEAIKLADSMEEHGVSISEDGTITIGGGRDGKEG